MTAPGIGKFIVQNPLPRYNSFPNPLGPEYAGSVSTHYIEVAEGIVEDVILNETHQEYSPDGYNVGTVKFRFTWDDPKPDEALNWAFPIASDIEDFPIKGEIVFIVWLLSRFYYLKSINIGNYATHQSFPNVRGQSISTINQEDLVREFEQTKTNPHNVSSEEEAISEYLIPDKVIYNLRHWEGDRIFQGRFGQSIRFGAAWKIPIAKYNDAFVSLEEDQAPNVIIRVGQPDKPVLTTDTIYARTVEDINNDKSSLWVVSNQVVPLSPSTTEIHTSVPDYPSPFSGNQIAVNSDRIIFNTKKDKILVHSANGYHVFTLKNSTMDVERDNLVVIGRDQGTEIFRNSDENVNNTKKMWIGLDYLVNVGASGTLKIGRNLDLHAGTKVSISAPKIFIGAHSTSEMTGGQPDSNTQHMVLGDKLVELLARLIEAITSPQPHVWTGTAAGYLNKEIADELLNIRSELNQMLSKVNFVSKTNEPPKSPDDRVPINPR